MLEANPTPEPAFYLAEHEMQWLWAIQKLETGIPVSGLIMSRIVDCR